MGLLRRGSSEGGELDSWLVEEEVIAQHCVISLLGFTKKVNATSMCLG